MTRTYKQPISALAVIHTQDGYFLLLERAQHPGYWQSVTGSREGEETPLTIAKREVFEETGLSPQLGVWRDWQHVERYTIWNEWRHRYAPEVTENAEHWFSFCLPSLIEVRDKVKLSADEHRHHRWLLAKEAAPLCFSPSNRALINRIAESINLS